LKHKSITTEDNKRHIIENMRLQIDLLEEQTKRREKLLNVQQSHMDIDESVSAGEEINKMYLEAIESKLAFLSNL